MSDFLFEILLAILEPFLDAILELIAGAILDLLSRILSDAFESLEASPPIMAALAYSVLGMVAGGFSVLLLPHHLVHPSRILGISLLISPVLTGAALSLVGAVVRSRHKNLTRIETFRYGFAFAFGMAVVRLLFAR